LPSTQTGAVAGHARPHAPQFAESRARSAQPVGHIVAPIAQLAAQWPALHTIPDGHATPQPVVPQCMLLVIGSTHCPPHAV
jgi:hypothetical protein